MLLSSITGHMTALFSKRGRDLPPGLVQRAKLQSNRPLYDHAQNVLYVYEVSPETILKINVRSWITKKLKSQMPMFYILVCALRKFESATPFIRQCQRAYYDIATMEFCQERVKRMSPKEIAKLYTEFQNVYTAAPILGEMDRDTVCEPHDLFQMLLSVDSIRSLAGKPGLEGTVLGPLYTASADYDYQLTGAWINVSDPRDLDSLSSRYTLTEAIQYVLTYKIIWEFTKHYQRSDRVKTIKTILTIVDDLNRYAMNKPKATRIFTEIVIPYQKRLLDQYKNVDRHSPFTQLLEEEEFFQLLGIPYESQAKQHLMQYYQKIGFGTVQLQTHFPPSMVGPFIKQYQHLKESLKFTKIPSNSSLWPRFLQGILRSVVELSNFWDRAQYKIVDEFMRQAIDDPKPVFIKY